MAKLNADGAGLVYSTYLGGSGDGQGDGIAVDGAGNAYVTGHTYSTNFPVTPGAYQTSCGGHVMTPSWPSSSADGASLVYSTYLGGTLRRCVRLRHRRRRRRATPTLRA